MEQIPPRDPFGSKKLGDLVAGLNYTDALVHRRYVYWLGQPGVSDEDFITGLIRDLVQRHVNLVRTLEDVYSRSNCPLIPGEIEMTLLGRRK